MTEVEVTVNGAVLEVCLTNPPANALTAPICRAIGEAFMRLRDDSVARCAMCAETRRRG